MTRALFLGIAISSTAVNVTGCSTQPDEDTSTHVRTVSKSSSEAEGKDTRPVPVNAVGDTMATYSKDWVTFRYPKSWTLSSVADSHAINLEHDLKVRFDMHLIALPKPANEFSESWAMELKETYEKHGELVPGSFQKTKRMMFGQMQTGYAWSMRLPGDVQEHYERYIVPIHLPNNKAALVELSRFSNEDQTNDDLLRKVTESLQEKTIRP